MFRVSELGRKDMINVNDGAKLGPVKDMEIDLETGTIKTVVLKGPRKYFGLFGSGKDRVVPWHQIKKVGQDAVLVEV